MEPDTEQVTMRKLRPVGPRLTVLETNVDEEQRGSGLIVPIGNDEHVHRGVILEVGSDVPHSLGLAEGAVVYFCYGTKIGDVTVVEVRDVLAFVDD